MAGAGGKRRRTRRRQPAGPAADPGASRWRLQHHPLGEGQPGLIHAEIAGPGHQASATRPMLAVDTVEALLHKGRIDQRAAAGARKFEAIFQAAHLSGLVSRDVRAAPGAFDPGNAAPHRVLAARDGVWAAMLALGGIGTPGANVVWDVLGLGMTIKAHAERCQFGGGRSLNPMTATGILVQSCFTLAAHYGK